MGHWKHGLAYDDCNLTCELGIKLLCGCKPFTDIAIQIFRIIYCHKWHNPLMKSLAKASRMNIALQVIQGVNAGMTVVEACREAGMSRSSFYYIVENNPEAIAEVQAIIDACNREQLGLMLLCKNELLRKVIEDGLSDKTKPRDRLAIFLKLNDLIQQMTKNQQVDEELERQAHEFLKQGPPLVKVKTRFTATVSYETET